MKARDVQIFIHKHYETIKLVLLFLTFGIVIYLVVSFSMANSEASRTRAEAVIDIVKSIETETDEQTKIINRQFQALCFLLVETSGEEALKRLDPPIEEQCRNLAQEIKEQERAESDELQVSESPRQYPIQQTTPAQDIQPAAEPTRSPQAEERRNPETSEPPEPNTFERLFNPIINPIRSLL